MQLAIDSSKRRFDIDIPKEIKLIKQQMDVKTNKYPMFWSVIKTDFNKKNLNSSIHCPMNYLYNLRFRPFKPTESTIQMNEFFIKHKMDEDKRKCKKIEELIQKYSLEIHTERNMENDTDYLLLRSDYEQLIKDLRQISFSKNTIGVMSWLIDRAFLITPAVRGHKSESNSTLNKNRALLVKILYDSNKNALFSCFKKKGEE